MIQVRVSSNTKRDTVIVPAETTPRQVFEQAGINYTSGISSLDGAPLRAGEMDKSFAEFGITERCTLMNVIKADNAGICG